MAYLYGISNILLQVDTSSLTDGEGRIFGIDEILGQGLLFQAIAVFILFAGMSFLLFEPVKKLLANRRERIKNDIESATQDKEDAAKLKEEYDSKIKEVNKEADEILSAARKKALKRENEIIVEAEEEAARILSRANQEIELEKSKVKDEVKVEIIKVATCMASKIVEASIDEAKQNELIDETLKEMGDETWLNK